MKTSNTIETLKQKRDSLIEKLRFDYSQGIKEEKLLKEIKTVEQQIKETELKQNIESVNKRDAIFKDFLKDLFNVGIISRDLITDSGKLHKNRQKQNPLLYALVEKYQYLYFTIGYQKQVITHFATLGLRKELENTSINYSLPKKDQKQQCFETLEQLCNYNRVLYNPIKLNDVKKQLQAINKATEKFEAERKKYDNELEKQQKYFLDNEGFLYTSPTHSYTHKSKF